MTETATVLGIFAADGDAPGPNGIGRGAAAAASCDAALTELPATHWRRKVNLLQGKALHHLEMGDAASAMRDLDQAEKAAALGKDDHLFVRSQQVGLNVVRAYALHQQERDDQAAKLLSEAQRMRPYDRGITLAGVGLAGFGGKTDDSLAALERYSRLEPGSRTQLAYRLFDDGRFAEFIALHPYLAPPRIDGPDYPSAVQKAVLDLRNWEVSVRYRIMFGALLAYAQTEQRQLTQAQATLTTVQGLQDPALAPPPPPKLNAVGLGLYTKQLAASRAAIAQRHSATEELTLSMNRRQLVAAGQAAQVAGEVLGKPIDASSANAHLLQALATALPSERAEQALAAIRSQLAQKRKAESLLDLHNLFATLPGAETAGQKAVMREGKRPALAMAGSLADVATVGYRNSVSTDGVTTVLYRGGKATKAQVEELALLRAAELARQSGRKAFMIVERRGRSLTMTSMYGTDPIGFESQIDVRFFDGKAGDPPAGLLLDADQVFADLAVEYISQQ